MPQCGPDDKPFIYYLVIDRPMPRVKFGFKPSKKVFETPRRRNYEGLAKAISVNKSMSPETKAKALATIKRKQRGF